MEHDCGRKVTRLKNLVERVLLTKKEWGSPSLAIEELAPVEAYVTADGSLTLIKSSRP